MVVTFHEDVKFHDELEWKRSNKKQWIDDLKQQRLEGQYRMVTKRYAISITVFFGLLFVGISLLLKSANRQVVLKKIRYDNVTENYIDIELNEPMPAPVYFYYELRNTFLMHRSANSAFCKQQLFGGIGGFQSLSDCDTLKNRKYSCENPVEVYAWTIFPKFCDDNQKYYAPVGGAAAMIFNDAFVLKSENQTIKWSENGVVAEELRRVFLHPPEGTEDLCEAEMFKNTLKPIGWSKHICEMGGYRNVDLIKWLESATYKNFKKLYRILDTKVHQDGLSVGKYRLEIENNYWPMFSREENNRMEKYFWILHPSWVGTEQTFLEYMYLIVGIGLLTLSCCLIGFQIFLMERRKTFDDDDNF